MNKPGRTPLMRAKKLEKYLGVEQIYLKLEGTNPYGHKFDRVSEVVVKDALNHKKNGLLVDGSDDYINSIIQFCENNDLTVKIPLFKNERWKESILLFTKEGNKGRGIASELINQMIELTGSKLSLHVDLDNKRAKKLYEKLGFKTSYYRMIYSKQQ